MLWMSKGLVHHDRIYQVAAALKISRQLTTQRLHPFFGLG